MVLFGKRRRPAAARQPAKRATPAPSETYVVAYDQMLKGNKLSRRGRPIRQVAVVVNGTVTLVTSGDTVDRKTYEALVLAGVLPGDERSVVPEVLEASEAAGLDTTEA
jgi:hypothetical protein